MSDTSPPIEMSNLRSTRLLTIPTLPLRPTKASLAGKRTTTPDINKIRTVKTEIGPQLPSLNLPRRLFKWIYSVSLVILVSFLLAFMAVTPIDVIVQTSSASSSGIKLFIVIIVCVVFLVFSFFLYFSRIFQHRVSMNDIPSKSVYIPGDNDFPQKVYKFLEARFNKCQEIKVKGGPLQNSNININYDGLSPPAYVQQRNMLKPEEHLPPNLLYEDIIRSFGEKFNFHDGFTTASPIDLPKQFTFRQIIMSLMKGLVEEGHVTQEEVSNLEPFITLYERSKFGGQLLSENEMVEFMVECERTGMLLHRHFGSVMAYRRRKTKKATAAQLVDSSLRQYSNSNLSNSYPDNYVNYPVVESEPEDYENYMPFYDEEESIDPTNHFRRRSEVSQLSRPSGAYSSQSNFPSSYFPSSGNFPSSSNAASTGPMPLPVFTRLHTSTSRGRDDDSDESVLKRDAAGSILRKPVTRDSSNSRHSIIKKKLSISEDIDSRKNSVTFNLGFTDPIKNHSRDSDTFLDPQKIAYQRPQKPDRDIGPSLVDGNGPVPELQVEAPLSMEETFRERSPSPHSIRGVEIKQSKPHKR